MMRTRASASKPPRQVGQDVDDQGRLARRGEIDIARSAPVVPADTLRTDPSGRVSEISPDSTAEVIDGGTGRRNADRRGKAERRARRGCSFD
jgi:hypothetical protein